MENATELAAQIQTIEAAVKFDMPTDDYADTTDERLAELLAAYDEAVERGDDDEADDLRQVIWADFETNAEIP